MAVAPTRTPSSAQSSTTVSAANDTPPGYGRNARCIIQGRACGPCAGARSAGRALPSRCDRVRPGCDDQQMEKIAVLGVFGGRVPPGAEGLLANADVVA